MIFPKMANAAATIAVLWFFCFGTAFSSDVSIALRGTRGLESENVDVYLCNEMNQRISQTITNKTEELMDNGYQVRVCLEATRLATSQDLYILKIDDFTFTKDRTNGDLAAAGPTRDLPPILRQKAVDHGLALSNDVTRVFCSPGDRVCSIETKLTGYFFLTSGTIMGKGSILMQLGNTARRDLQSIQGFEDVYMEIDFTGGARTAMPPKKKRIVIITGVVIGALAAAACCFGVIFCCFAGLCCFAGRRKEETYYEEEEGIEEISVTMDKKRRESGDYSETESLEDDKYWDDEVPISDDEDEAEPGDHEINYGEDFDEGDFISEDFRVEDEDIEMVPVALPAPSREEEEEKPVKQSRRSSSKSSEELAAIPNDSEPQTPRSKAKKKKKVEGMDDGSDDLLMFSPEQTPNTKKKKKKKIDGADAMMLSPGVSQTPKSTKSKKKKKIEGVDDGMDDLIMFSPEQTPSKKKKKKKIDGVDSLLLSPGVSQTPKSTKSKKKKKIEGVDDGMDDLIMFSPEQTPSKKKKKKKIDGVDSLLLSPETPSKSTKSKKKKKVAVDSIADFETPRTRQKKKKRPSTTAASFEPPITE